MAIDQPAANPAAPTLSAPIGRLGASGPGARRGRRRRSRDSRSGWRWRASRWRARRGRAPAPARSAQRRAAAATMATFGGERRVASPAQIAMTTSARARERASLWLASGIWRSRPGSAPGARGRMRAGRASARAASRMTLDRSPLIIAPAAGARRRIEQRGEADQRGQDQSDPPARRACRSVRLAAAGVAKSGSAAIASALATTTSRRVSGSSPPAPHERASAAFHPASRQGRQCVAGDHLRGDRRPTISAAPPLAAAPQISPARPPGTIIRQHGRRRTPPRRRATA